MEGEPQQQTARSGLFTALAWMRDLAFSVLLAIILIVFIYQPVKVEGTSMMPVLTDQERIFINKFTYRFGAGNIERRRLPGVRHAQARNTGAGSASSGKP